MHGVDFAEVRLHDDPRQILTSAGPWREREAEHPHEARALDRLRTSQEPLSAFCIGSVVFSKLNGAVGESKMTMETRTVHRS